jgi:hypothetical protein
VTDDDQRRRAQRDFLQLLLDAELPPPDEISWEDRETIFRWNGPQLQIHLDPFRDDEMDPIDNLTDAILRGVPVEDWPVLE